MNHASPPRRPHRRSDGIQRILDADGRVIGYRVQIRRTGYPVVSKRFTRLDDARVWRSTMVPDIEHRRLDPAALAQRHTINAAIDAYLLGRMLELKRSTQREQKARLEWWRRRLGPLALRDLTRSMVLDALGQLGCTGATRNRYQSTLSSVLSCAQEREWVVRNVARELKRQRDAKRRERVITAKEWQGLVAAAEAAAAKEDAPLRDRQFPHYLQLLYATGMRASELLGLPWSDVDLGNRTAYLRDTKNHQARTVQLDASAITALEAMKALAREGWPWVFTGRGPLAPASRFNQEFKAARDAAGITPDANGEQLVLHSLRHSFATELANSGADLFELMAATGHKSIAAAQRYIKTQDAAAVRALEKRKRPGGAAHGA